MSVSVLRGRSQRSRARAACPAESVAESLRRAAAALVGGMGSQLPGTWGRGLHEPGERVASGDHPAWPSGIGNWTREAPSRPGALAWSGPAAGRKKTPEVGRRLKMIVE